MKAIKYIALSIACVALTSCGSTFTIRTPYGDLNGSKGGLVLLPNAAPIVIPTK